MICSLIFYTLSVSGHCFLVVTKDQCLESWWLTKSEELKVQILPWLLQTVLTSVLLIAGSFFFLNLVTTLCARVFCRGTQRSASAPQSSPLVLMCLFETRSDIPQADLELCETKNDLECKILLPSSPSAEITGVHPNTQQLAFLTELVVSTTHCEPAF